MGFDVKQILHGKARSLIHLETGPGLGCTEPAAIGLATAAAASLLPGGHVDSVHLSTDANIHKNAMGVVTPNSGGRASIPLAAAMGAVGGDPGQGLQVFAAVTQPKLAKARRLVEEGRVAVDIAKDVPGLYVKAVVKAGDAEAVAVIRGQHDNIACLSLNGRELNDHPLLNPAHAAGAGELPGLEKWLEGLGTPDLLDLLEDMDHEDLDYIRQGLRLNQDLAEYGLRHGPGLGVGRSQLSLMRQGALCKDMPLWGGIHAAAGIDARMGGVALPAMTLAGSGNQGIAAGTPIAAAAEFATLEDETLVLKAVTLSYLITCLIKARVGRLSALCGSAVAAGAGAAAGVAYLLGGTADKVGGAVTNHIENTAALICDGAKTSCALKVGEAAASGVKSALLALSGCVVRPIDGVAGRTGEESMANLGKLSREGLSNM
ncbi:MAG: L-serine ammonia-lyase, iron-sulfur-dependent, subunit alpha, partial [Desulfovibrionaceae bacterium]